MEVVVNVRMQMRRRSGRLGDVGLYLCANSPEMTEDAEPPGAVEWYSFRRCVSYSKHDYLDQNIIAQMVARSLFHAFFSNGHIPRTVVGWFSGSTAVATRTCAGLVIRLVAA